jgi:hypothetical protein
MPIAKKKKKKVWLFVYWIKLDPYSFYCNVFGIESFIGLFFFSISSLNIWFLYQIWFFFFLLFFFYPFLNWNYFSISFLMIWFDLIWLNFCVKFGPHSFEVYIFYPFFKKQLSLIILVGWEFDNFFFRFAFYAVIWPRDRCYKFWRLDQVGFTSVVFMSF